MPQLVFIEGIDLLVSDASDKRIVMPFMSEMQHIAAHFHCAIVGSTGAPKTKQKEGYTAKRDTIFGSEVWSRMSETIVTVQCPGGNDMADQREISILLRNAKPEQFLTRFDHGKLVPMEQPEEDDISPKLREAVFFLEEALQGRGPMKSDWLKEEASMQKGIRPSDLDAAARSLMESGHLTMKRGTKKGQFLWELTQMHAGTEVAPEPEPTERDLLPVGDVPEADPRFEEVVEGDDGAEEDEDAPF